MQVTCIEIISSCLKNIIQPVNCIDKRFERNDNELVKGDNMIGIIICTHSNFAEGLKNSCEMIAGKQENLAAVCFDGTEQLTDLAARMKTQEEQFNGECIYVVDLMNATPFNAALINIAYTKNVVLSGASLPMMLELVIQRNSFEGSAADLAKMIVGSSSEYVGMKTSEDVFK